MKKNSGLILILVVILLVGFFSSSNDSGSNGSSIGGGTTDVIVPPGGDDGSTDIIIPPGGDDGSTDIIIPPGGDEPTEEVPTKKELLEACIDVPEDVVTIEYYDGMTWLDYFNSELYENCWTEFTINDGDDFIYNCDFDDGVYMLMYYLDGDCLSVTVNDEIDSSFEYSLVLRKTTNISFAETGDEVTIYYYDGMSWKDYFNSALNVFNGDDYDMVEFIDGDDSIYYREYVLFVPTEDGEELVSYNHKISSEVRYYFYEVGDGA